MPKADPFSKAPEFLAAFQNIRKNGFFASMTFSVGSVLGDIHSCTIMATGYIPNLKKYAANGCGQVIDPQRIIAACRKLALRKPTKSVYVKVMNEDWPLYDKDEKEVIGSKGSRVTLAFTVYFK